MPSSNQPQVIGIQICEEKGQPMTSIETAQIIETGIQGDRYATGKGAWSNSRPPRNVDRHITLISQEAIDAIKKETGIDVTFSETRRNLLVIGIDLNNYIGRKLRIGDVIVEGVELCDPCARPGILSGRDELKKGDAAFATIFANRGGLRVRVLQTGVIHNHDTIGVSE